MGKNKDLDHFLSIKNSITLKHIRDYCNGTQKQKKIFEKLCGREDLFIQLGDPRVFSKTQLISRKLIIEENVKTGLGLLAKYKSALKKPATKGFKYIFKIKRSDFFSGLASVFTLPLTIRDRKKLIGFLAASGLINEDRKDYLDFSNFILLEKIDERYLEIFPTVFIDTAGYLSGGCLPGEYNPVLRLESELSRFLSEFIKNSRNRNILKMYYGLAAGRRASLNEISLKYGISCRRVEQITRSLMNKLSYGRESGENQQLTLGLDLRLKDKIYYGLFSLAVLLFTFLFRECGKIYIRGRDPVLSDELFLKMIFIFRLLNIPFYRIAGMDAYIFGVSKEAGKKISMLIAKQGSKKFREIIDSESIKKYISGIANLFLSQVEIDRLSLSINEYLNGTSQIREIVYAALKKIDRPAHYSEITKVCNNMFSDRIFTPKQIHRSLASASQDLWVWIGLRGVYALKEWGFIKPDTSLNRTVFEIVNLEFKKTARPVTINHIYREIGNYREAVNENSLYFACNFNPGIRVLKKGLFVPRLKDEVDKPVKKDMKFLDDLDRRFRGF